jgi:sortase A
VGVAGRILIGAGILVLLFVVFEIFGTAYLQQRHQAALRSQIDPTHVATRVPTTAPEAPATPITVPHETPPAPSAPVAVIDIPKIGLNQVVVQGTGEAQLELGPGHYRHTPLPGEAGNVGIAGHRTTWGHPFYFLDQLAVGDPIYLLTDRGTFLYTVTAVEIVLPTDVDVLDTTATPTLTLTTCNPRYSAEERLVVHAALSSTFVSFALHPTTPAPAARSSHVSPGSGQPGVLVSVLWGGVVALMCLGAWFTTTRLRHRWLVYLVATPFVLVGLFFFFDTISAHLPAGY